MLIILSALAYMNFIDFGKINYIQLSLYTSTFLTNSTYSNEPQHKVKSECTYENNFTVYMDSFEKVTKMYLGQSYQHFFSASHHLEGDIVYLTVTMHHQMQYFTMYQYFMEHSL